MRKTNQTDFHSYIKTAFRADLGEAIRRFSGLFSGIPDAPGDGTKAAFVHWCRAIMAALIGHRGLGYGRCLGDNSYRRRQLLCAVALRFLSDDIAREMAIAEARASVIMRARACVFKCRVK